MENQLKYQRPEEDPASRSPCFRFCGFKRPTPRWKTRTPYKCEFWRVPAVRGTMVTAQRGEQRVTRNVSWFQRVDPEGERASREVYDEYGNTNSEVVAVDGQADRLTPHCNLKLPRNQERPDELAGRSERYHLRSNPPPSQRLRHFIC
ncbi:hypothetical protein NDU88_004951 [Pleurodeles waltl]|uniref:Uncharacterized protein n=1 Tax=Pleurodeles waltl TaxID=8319 RepID=A0AAV7RH60_PLEWA|nr:hypothetical protein NDU88_004951 [Pleurodeles waltl]